MRLSLKPVQGVHNPENHRSKATDQTPAVFHGTEKRKNFRVLDLIDLRQLQKHFYNYNKIPQVSFFF